MNMTIKDSVRHTPVRGKTTACSRKLALLYLALILIQLGCSRSQPPATEHEEEALSRTEFTERLENYFEYQPLKAGKQSQFLIHLTDLSDGTPVEKAEVTLSVRIKGTTNEIAQTKAKIGKVTGIYVADLTIPNKGDYDIEFHIQNQKVNERLPLKDFKVE
jgi:5-hydroxyisourate hydrolase-like protein (transthyretin family)